MGIDLDDINKMTSLAALLQQGAVQLFAFIANKQAQSGKSKEEIDEHAASANAEAKKLIEAL